MLAETVAPPDDHYSFVMVTATPRWNPAQRQVVTTYNETVSSFNITHADGVNRTTVFVRTEHARNALSMRGWNDATAAWMDARTATENAVEPVPATEPDPTPTRRPKRRGTRRKRGG